MLVIKSVIEQLESSTRYSTLSRLTIDWSNLIGLSTTLPTIDPVNEKSLEHLEISIMEL